MSEHQALFEALLARSDGLWSRFARSGSFTRRVDREWSDDARGFLVVAKLL